MAAYREHKAREAEKPSAPFCVLTLVSSMFRPGWSGAPKIQTKVGLRLLSTTEETSAREWADQQARLADVQQPDLFVQAYNEALMLGLVSRALCSPTDAAVACSVFQVPDESILGDALTSATLRYLFEELEKAKVAAGPAHEELDDEGICRLLDCLDGPGALDHLDAPEAKLCRRLLAEVAELVGVTDGE